MTTAHYTPEVRINHSLTAVLEKRALIWMAHRAPGWVTSDQLTGLGLLAQVDAGVCYAFAARDRRLLLVGILCIAANWLGDSLDGTLARVRNQQRPRYGFYVDHMADLFGSLALMGGLALSGFLHPATASLMLVAFLLLSGESYLATHTVGRFHLSQGVFGPTEIRLLLCLGNLVLLHSPWCTVAGHPWLLFDLGGIIASAGMFAMAMFSTLRHAGELSRQEPLP